MRTLGVYETYEYLKQVNHLNRSIWQTDQYRELSGKTHNETVVSQMYQTSRRYSKVDIKEMIEKAPESVPFTNLDHVHEVYQFAKNADFGTPYALLIYLWEHYGQPVTTNQERMIADQIRFYYFRLFV